MSAVGGINWALSAALLACGDTARPAVAVVNPATSSSATPPVPSASGSEDCPRPTMSVPTPAWSGRQATLPAPPAIAARPVRDGDAFTVFGAQHALRSRYQFKDVTERSISIVGVIVDTNVDRAPPCAVHPTGKADPPNCTSEIPAFTVADGEGTEPRIRVLGWASNFANVYQAWVASKKSPPEHVQDELWVTDVPTPLPAVGAKVKVTGHYATTFNKASSGVVSDPVNGLMTVERVEVLVPAPSAAKFPPKH